MSMDLPSHGVGRGPRLVCDASIDTVRASGRPVQSSLGASGRDATAVGRERMRGHPGLYVPSPPGLLCAEREAEVESDESHGYL